MKRLRLRVEQNGQSDRYGNELRAVIETSMSSPRIIWQLDGYTLPQNRGRVIPVLVEDNDTESPDPASPSLTG